MQKGVYLYEYMDDWEKLMKFHYLKKKIFIVTKIWKILLMQTTGLRKKFLRF